MKGLGTIIRIKLEYRDSCERELSAGEVSTDACIRAIFPNSSISHNLSSFICLH